MSRSEIFRQSVFVDNQIAFHQQAIHRTMSHDDSNEVAYMTPLLDHLHAFNSHPKTLNAFCILAYAAANKNDYESNFPLVVVDFFKRLKIEVLYLLTEFKNDWKDYMFENEEKKDLFLSLVAGKTDGFGYLLKVKDLPAILPLFFFTHPDYPHIILLPQSADILVDMFICKDGNLHTLFNEKNNEQLKAAAESAGLYIGSYEVCHLYRNTQL